MDREILAATVEAILFASERPITTTRIQEVLGDEAPPEKIIEEACVEIMERYEGDNYGFEVRRAQGGFQFCTKQKYAEWVRKFLATRPFRLSRSALETLAIVAYRQPITRAEVDKVRGIDSSHLMRTLIEKGIVKMAGKADVPGRPVQYATTSKFLDLIGLKSVNELPPLSELTELEGEVPQKRDRLEEGMERFIDSQEILDDRTRALEDELQDIDGMIKSIGKPADQDVFASPLHREIAEENQAAVTGFQTFSRSWKRKAAKAQQEKEQEAAAETNSQTEEPTMETPAKPSEESALDTQTEPTEESLLETQPESPAESLPETELPAEEEPLSSSLSIDRD